MDIDTFISLLRAEAKKYHKQYTPTPEQVKLRKKLKKQGHYIEGNVRRGNYNNAFQNFLVNWANDFEVNGLKEYKVPRLIQKLIIFVFSLLLVKASLTFLM